MTTPKTTAQGKRELSLTSMYFNRYLLFRYVTAIFFFVNLYWLIVLAGSGSWSALVPATLVLGAGAVMVEQVGKYWHRNHQLRLTRTYYWVQLAVNLVLMLSLAVGRLNWFYPFLTIKSVPWVLGFLALGLVLSGWLEYRAHLIEHDRDRYLRHIKQFAASL